MASKKTDASVTPSQTPLPSDGPILFNGIRLPANVMLPNGYTGFAIGSHLKSGFGIEGLVKEIRELGPNVLITLETGARVVLFGSGMLGECL